LLEIELEAFLAEYLPIVEERVHWGSGRDLKVRAYLSQKPPPLGYISSVRCVVIREDGVLVVKDEDGFHIFPGGRREPGESLEDTLRRGVLEETGWSLGALSLLGFLYYHDLGERPPGHRLPFPDFL